MSLSDRDTQHIWHPFTQMKLSPTAIPIVKGQGALLIDEQGKEYIDAVSSWWVNIHGHAHPYIAEKVAEQLKTLEHVIFAGFTHPPAVELAERLLSILPEGQSKVFFSDNGSTAVEVALKMAFQYWHNRDEPKTKVVALENAYHGDTFGAMSVSGRSAFTEPFAPLLFDVEHIPLPGKDLSSKELMEQKIRSGELAAFIYEPLVQGAGGMLMYEPEALDELIALCKKHGVLVIADEVMTGFGRTGKLFASQHMRHQPDIMCLSKGLTGGTMAMGITSCTDSVYDAFLADDKLKTFFHGHSYTANPVACSAALASMDLLLKDSCTNDRSRIAHQHKEFADALNKHKKATRIRQQGTILAFDIKIDESTSYFAEIRDEAYRFFIEHGVLLRPLGNTLYIMPPYCIENAQLEVVYQAITDYLDSL